MDIDLTFSKLSRILLGCNFPDMSSSSCFFISVLRVRDGGWGVLEGKGNAIRPRSIRTDRRRSLGVRTNVYACSGLRPGDLRRLIFFWFSFPFPVPGPCPVPVMVQIPVSVPLPFLLPFPSPFPRTED